MSDFWKWGPKRDNWFKVWIVGLAILGVIWLVAMSRA